MHRPLAAALAAFATAVGAAPIAQANFVATADDPAGDATDPSPGRDITAVGFSYDHRSGELIGAVRLRGEPGEQPALVSLFAGTRTASGCDGFPATGFGSDTSSFEARWLRLNDASGSGPRGDADKTGYRAAIQKFEATDRQLAGQRPDCVVAILSELGNASNAYDSVGPIALVGQPELALRVSGVPKVFAPGRPRRIKVTLTNGGDAPTRRVALTLSRARGVTVKAKRALGPIQPGKRVTVTATVTVSRRARAATDVKVTATAGELRARGETTFYVRKPASGGGGGTHRPGVCTRWIPDLSGETGGSLILVPC